MLSPARSRQWAMRLGSKLFRRTGCGATLIYTHRPLPSLVRGAFSTGTTRATRQEKEEKTMEQPNDAHQSRTASGRTTLETLHFDNRALRVLPIDPLNENFPRKVRLNTRLVSQIRLTNPIFHLNCCFLTIGSQCLLLSCDAHTSAGPLHRRSEFACPRAH